MTNDKLQQYHDYFWHCVRFYARMDHYLKSLPDNDRDVVLMYADSCKRSDIRKAVGKPRMSNNEIVRRWRRAAEGFCTSHLPPDAGDLICGIEL